MTDKEIENFVNWLQSCTAKKFYSADAEDLIFEFKNQALSQHDVIKSKITTMTDLEKFIDTYKQFGIDIKTKNEGERIIINLNGWDEDSTKSIKFDGHTGFYSDLEFDKDGKFIMQWFGE